MELRAETFAAGLQAGGAVRLDQPAGARPVGVHPASDVDTEPALEGRTAARRIQAHVRAGLSDDDGSDFLITMERVDGEPLHRALRETRDWQVIVPRIVQVCRALSYVHSRRIVHFDLKPANILVDPSGRVKVVDFGIAGAEPVTHNGGIMGTPQYMAPELLLGTGSADHRADLYALGVTLYELLTGDVPCPKRDIWELARWLNAGGVRLAPAANIPEWLAKLVEKLCANDPADRQRNANAVVQEINAGSGFDYELETAETRQSYVMTPRFTGRAHEHAQVIDFVTQRLTGRGVEPALMVSGLSGIGKSRLMREVRHAAQLQRWVFLEANCYERSLVEYGPIADILQQLVPLIETLGGVDIVQSALPELVKLAPQLAKGRSHEASPAAVTADGERGRLLETSAEFFVRAARVVPFVIYVNDMQWAGRGPAELFAYVAQRVRDDQSQGEVVKLALIGSYRSDEVEGRALEDTLKRLHKQKLSLDIELTPLAGDDVNEVIRSMLGIDEVPREFLERVTHETSESCRFPRPWPTSFAVASICCARTKRTSCASWRCTAGPSRWSASPTCSAVPQRRWRRSSSSSTRKSWSSRAGERSRTTSPTIACARPSMVISQTVMQALDMS